MHHEGGGMRNHRCVLLALAVAACTGSETTPPSSSRLGMVQVEVDEAANRLDIVGLDANGARIAQLTAERGMFDVEDFGVTLGLHMKIDVLGTEIEHTSAGTQPRVLPLFEQPDMALV